MTAKDYRVCLLLGGNLNDLRATFVRVIDELSLLGEVEKVSSLYRTAAWGMEDAPDFYNQAVLMTTELQPLELLKSLQQIEINHGRRRKPQGFGYESRMLDIDILLINDLVIDSPELKIPHPRMHLRNFTLWPLSEIAGSFIHPIYKKTVEELKRDCEDTLEVEKL